MTLKPVVAALARAFGYTTVQRPESANWQTLLWYTVPIDVRLKSERRRLVIHEPTKETKNAADQVG